MWLLGRGVGLRWWEWGAGLDLVSGTKQKQVGRGRAGLLADGKVCSGTLRKQEQL